MARDRLHDIPRAKFPIRIISGGCTDRDRSINLLHVDLKKMNKSSPFDVVIDVVGQNKSREPLKNKDPQLIFYK